MRKRPNPFADLPPITDFESCQRVRPLLFHRLADLAGLWRYCGNATCLRARSCRHGDGTCSFIDMQTRPEEERRLLRYAVDNRLGGLAPDEALARAQERIREENARDAENGWTPA